jgi:hypothetical protein
MRARLRDVPVGTRFVTLITAREGRVRAHEADEVVVTLAGRERRLDPRVVVDADEVAH